MSNHSRTANSIRNIVVGLSYQLVLLLLSFISRTIFINVLGPEYLGINGLYSNILSVLSLAELGVGSAIIYSLYKPIIERDNKKIGALINFYKEMYRYIAISVAAIGISIIPFLNLLIKTENPIANLKLYYFLFLADIVVGYLFMYKSSILNADQKMYLVKLYSFLFQVAKTVLQIIIIYYTHNYILYLLIQVISTLLNNIYIAYKSDQLYPEIKKVTNKLDDEERKKIFNNIQSMFVYRIGGVALNNTDNIIISSMIGIVWVGIYSNYVLIVGAIQTMVDILFTSINASIGNLNADEDNQNKEIIFNALNFSAFWVYGIFSISLLNLLNDFIKLWLGNIYVMDSLVIFAITLNFYIPGILKSTFLYRDTTGLFNKTKYVSLITAILNLGLSVFLGNIYGLSGILLATAASRLLTNFWYEPIVLYKEYFIKSSRHYFFKQAYYFGILILTNSLVFLVTSQITTTTVASFMYKTIACFLLSNVAFYIFLRKAFEFKYLSNKIMYLIKPV